MHSRQPRRLAQWVPAGYALVLALVIMGPLLGPGYLLLRDAVSTPRSHLTDSALGISDAAPRAVPQDAVLAMLTTVLDGGILVKAILLLSLWAAGVGAARMVRALLPTVGLGGQLVAVTVALWNPFVAERLLQGHWSLLTGYAALPWVVSASVAMRRRGTAGAMLVALACAGLTPTGAVTAGLLALVLAALPGGRRRGRRLLVVAAALLAVSSPWLLAAVLGGSGAGSDPAGVAAFAARAEPGLGTLGSLAGLGGIWNSLAVPGTRTTLLALLGTAVLLALVASGLRGMWRRRRNPVLAAVLVIAVLAVLLPAVAATGPGLALARLVVESIPGAGLGRDAQKWVALAMPGYALAAAFGADSLGKKLQDKRAGRGLAVGAAYCALLLLALPDLAWGVGGALRPADYPPGWSQVAELATPGDGAVAVLPAGSFRRFDGGPVVLDPAARWLRADVLDPGDLVVGGVAGQGVTVTGEGPGAQAALLAGGPPERLAGLGVGWVLVEHGTPGDLGASADTLAGLDRVYSDPDLSLYRVPGPIEWSAAPGAARIAALGAHALWLAVLAGGLGLIVRERVARRLVMRDLAERRH